MKHRLKLKRVVLLELILIMIICMFSGCSKSSKLKKNGEIYLYYTNKDRTKLISKTYNPEGDDTIAQIEEVLNQMNTSVKKKNCITAKPESVAISGYTLYDKTVNIDFSSSYYEMSKVTELLCRSAIVLSITQIKGVDSTVRETTVELEENAKDITIWESEYQRQCMELWGDNSAEKFAHASLLLNAWKQYEQTNIRLRYYWEQAWDENGIRRTVLEEDENLIAIEELGEEVEYTGIFRGSVADWRARMLLHKAYQQSGTEEPVCPVVPQAAWLWKEAFSGNSVLFLIFTVLIILLHFDAWANEFEYATCYRLYILPIKKEWLYLERFFVRVLVSVVCVGSAAGILFLLGTARYGTGGQMLLVISEQGTQTVISIWSLVREEILGMLLYIVFLTAAVLLISFIVKTKMNALMICAAFCMTGIVQTTASDGTGKGIVEWLPQLSALTLLMLLAGCILIRIRED